MYERGCRVALSGIGGDNRKLYYYRHCMSLCRTPFRPAAVEEGVVRTAELLQPQRDGAGSEAAAAVQGKGCAEVDRRELVGERGGCFEALEAVRGLGEHAEERDAGQEGAGGGGRGNLNRIAMDRMGMGEGRMGHPT